MNADQPLGDLSIRTRTALDDAACKVIDTARCIERAAQYGLDATIAHRAYTQARVELLRLRYGLAGGPS